MKLYFISSAIPMHITVDYSRFNVHNIASKYVNHLIKDRNNHSLDVFHLFLDINWFHYGMLIVLWPTKSSLIRINQLCRSYLHSMQPS